MTRAEKTLSRLLLAVQLLVITLGLTVVIYHSIQFFSSSLTLLQFFMRAT
jgi:hypothetical protein